MGTLRMPCVQQWVPAARAARESGLPLELPQLRVATARRQHCPSTAPVALANRVRVTRSAGGLRPVHLACLKGHDEVVRALIAAGCDVAAATEAGDHAIHFASRAGNTNMCSDLIEAGADLEASSLAGTTPLACAANAGHEGCVRFLLKRGASATVLDGHSCSPLHLAAAGGHLHVVQLLLANGCDGLQLNSHGQSPLDLAVGKETKAALSGGAAAASS